jgi:hypothetical protein
MVIVSVFVFTIKNYIKRTNGSDNKIVVIAYVTVSIVFNIDAIDVANIEILN